MSYRIGVCGAAGTGKSSLARAIADALEMPFLESKEITQDILARDGYDYASGVQVERFLANSGRQNEILRRTIEQQEAENFVTDRTVIDLAAYAVCEMHDKDAQVVKDIIETCRKNVGRYTFLVLCPWRDVPVMENNRRTLNPWYQFLIDVIETGILNKWGCKCFVVTKTELPDRLAEVLEAVKAQ